MKKELISQYRSALKMLINAIDQCPDNLWADANYHSPYWQIAYHTLHFTALYLSRNELTFIPWPNHHPGVHQLGTLSLIQNSDAMQKGYSKSDLQEYTAQIEKSLEQNIDEHKLTEPSGFEWLAMNKFELHLYNLRHLQHHLGQLIERLHQNDINGIDWIGTTR
jgi:hypothetical protein